MRAEIAETVEALLAPEQTRWRHGGQALVSVRALLAEYIVPRLASGGVTVLAGAAAQDAPSEVAPAGPAPTHYVLPRHRHEQYEVCWVIEGRCVLSLDGRRVLLTPQWAHVIRPGEVHHLLPTARLEPFRTLWWLAAPGGLVLDEGMLAHGHRQATATFVPLAVDVPPLIEAVVEELRARRPHHALFARLRLLEIAAAALRAIDEAYGRAAAQPAPAGGAGQAAGLVRRLTQYIATNHGPHVTLRHLAALVGLSPNYVTTLFRTYTGRPLMVYVADVRHRHAADLLRTTRLTVAAVAREAGFSDPSYFDRCFRQREGFPPLAYRRLHQVGAAADDAAR
jgi:AraC-like DNA-binding protein/mannose-6-phosphate isomerase-like protein (cupin superfamily)